MESAGFQRAKGLQSNSNAERNLGSQCSHSHTHQTIFKVTIVLYCSQYMLFCLEIRYLEVVVAFKLHDSSATGVHKFQEFAWSPNFSHEVRGDAGNCTRP